MPTSDSYGLPTYAIIHQALRLLDCPAPWPSYVAVLVVRVEGVADGE